MPIHSRGEEIITSAQTTSESTSEPSLFRRRRVPILISACVLGVLLACFWLLNGWYKDKLMRDERADVTSQLSLYAGSLVSILSQRASEVESLVVLVENSEEVTNDEFNNYARQVKSRIKSIRLYSLNPDKLGVHLYPSSGSDEILVTDPRKSTDPAIREAVAQTISSDETAIIVTRDEGKLYLEEWLSIRKNDELIGLANISYYLENIFSEARISYLVGGVNLMVRDGTGEVILGNRDVIVFPENQPVPLTGGNWQLSATPRGGWDEAIGRELTLFNVSGLTIIILITALVFLLASRQGSLSRAVRLRTRELGESRQRYQQLFEASPDALFVIDPSGRITQANPVATQRYGYSLEEFRRMNVRDLSVSEKQNQVADQLARSVGAGGTFEWLHRRRDGSTLPVEINTRPIYIDGAQYSIASVRDISERKHAGEALKASEQKFRTLFEESRDAVFISTPEGRLVDINQAGIELLGYGSKEELMDLDFGAEISGKKAARDAYEQAMGDKGFVKDFEVVLRRKDGKLLTVLISATAHREAAGGDTSYRGTMRDVTEERRLSEQLVQAQKMESVGQLAGGIAHDFNNLLTAIQGYIDLSLAQAPKDSELFEDLSEARRVTDRAGELTRQMLLFSRREPAKMEILDLNEIVNALLNMLNRLLGERYRVTTSFGEGLNRVEADSSYIEQVIMNLVVNARDSMLDGGEITISTGNVHLDEDFTRKENPEAPAGEYVQLSVRDHGEGMDSQTLGSIFEPFFSTKDIGKGTGLGLSVVYGLITQLNGLIQVESTPGEGSTFNIYFPVAAATVTKQVAEEPGGEGLDGSAERILLVEDEDKVRDIAERVLQAHGYRVTLAADADAALAAFDPNDGFDLVFSDVILPGENGLSLARRLQQQRPGLKVLLTSGYVEEKQLRDIREKGIPFLPKPYTMQDLLHMVRDALAA